MSSRVLILIFLMVFIPLTTTAAESVNDFEIELLPADGQQNFSEGYFNLDAEPGQRLTLNLRVSNNGAEPIELHAEAVDSWTAKEGGILYGKNSEANEEDSTWISDLLEVQETITVPGDAVENLHFHIDIPADARGTFLGGIMLTAGVSAQDLSMEIVNNSGSNYTFEQEGQRLVAVKLNLPDKLVTGFSLGKAKFDSEHNQLTMRLLNGNSAVLENVQGTYNIMDKDGETLISGVIDPFAMSPESDIRFPIDLKDHVFEEGKYILMLKGSADKKEFFAEEKFSVSEASQQPALAGETLKAAPAESGYNFIPAIAIALAGLFLLLPLLMKFSKRKEKNPYLNLSDKNNL